MTALDFFRRLDDGLASAEEDLAAIRAGLDALAPPPIARPSSSAPARRRAGHQTLRST